jgi:hypothetical protein
MIRRGRPSPSKTLNSESVACAWNLQIRLHNNFARSLCGRTRSPTILHAKLGLSLASFLSLVAVGCSLSQLNLDINQESFATPTQDNSRGRRRNVRDDPNAYVRNPRTYMRTVFPGDHTGIERYDTAQLDSTPYVRSFYDYPILAPYDPPQRADSNVQRNRVTDFAAGVLPVPSGYWSIFALISADNSESESESARPVSDFAHRHGLGTALSWMRRNIVPAVAGSLADVYNDNPLQFPPSKAHIDGALRQALALLDGDLRTTTTTTTTDARTVPLTTRQAGQAPSTLLAFFDSESRMLRIANAGAGRAFLGRRVTGAGGGGHECREITSSGGAQYAIYSDTHSNVRGMDVVAEELIDGTGSASSSPSRGEPDAASANVDVESVDVRDGDFLVLGSHGTWTRLDGNEAVQAVSGWMREQEAASSSQEEQQPPIRRGGGSWWPRDRFLDFPWRDNHGLGFGFDWVHTMAPDLIRDVDKMFVGARGLGNAASRVLQLEHKHSRDGNSGNDQDAAVPPGRSRPAPGSE